MSNVTAGRGNGDPSEQRWTGEPSLTPSTLADGFVNRRIRNRTYGGVVGGGGDPASYPMERRTDPAAFNCLASAAISTCSRSRACRSVRPEWSAMALRRAAVTPPAPGRARAATRLHVGALHPGAPVVAQGWW